MLMKLMLFDQEKAGIGIILNTQGNMVVAASILENEVSNPKTIEALAIFR